MNHCILLRGIPGCGKTTRALELCQGDPSCIFSADNFFVKDFVYQYDFNKIYLAHKKCRDDAVEAMKASRPLVIIDNTHVRLKDCKMYVREALAYGYEVSFEYPTSDWWKRTEKLLRNKQDNWPRLLPIADFLAEKNVHRVPREHIIKMMEKWQFLDDLPAFLESCRQVEPVSPPEETSSATEQSTGTQLQ